MGELNPFRYRGYYYDEDTSFYYLQSRYYDPVTCKFINIDEPAILFETAGSVLSAHLWDYCENNPIMYVDYTGNKKTSITIFITSDFLTWSTRIRDELAKAFPRYSCLIHSYNSSAKFSNKWNKLKNQDVVVILAHGTYDSLQYLSPSNIQKLKRINCKLLVILGCNCGHYDYTNLNIAYEFSKKITGVAIASDGTVILNYYKKRLKLSSIANSEFFDQSRKYRPNKGWMMYEYKNKKSYVFTTPFKDLYFNSLITYLKIIKRS